MTAQKPAALRKNFFSRNFYLQLIFISLSLRNVQKLQLMTSLGDFIVRQFGIFICEILWKGIINQRWELVSYAQLKKGKEENLMLYVRLKCFFVLIPNSCKVFFDTPLSLLLTCRLLKMYNWMLLSYCRLCSKTLRFHKKILSLCQGWHLLSLQ